jgi:hypothetical protein
MSGVQEAAFGVNKNLRLSFLDIGGYHREIDNVNYR